MDVIELLNKQKLSYTVSGQDYTIQCLSPDHEDNNPSLRIDTVSYTHLTLPTIYSV